MVARSKASPIVPYMTQAIAVQLHPIQTSPASARGVKTKYSPQVISRIMLASVVDMSWIVNVPMTQSPRSKPIRMRVCGIGR
jgi:hypothetical protein